MLIPVPYGSMLHLYHRPTYLLAAKKTQPQQNEGNTKKSLSLEKEEDISRK